MEIFLIGTNLDLEINVFIFFVFLFSKSIKGTPIKIVKSASWS